MAEAVNKIRHVGGLEKTAYTYYPVLIIGAGESGIAMGCRLQQALGFNQFRIFERKSGLGGTWYINRYPGIACDVPAILYSYSFAQNPQWTSLFPSGAEIVRYLYDVCARFNILDKIQLNTGVTGLKWIEEDEEWEVTLEHMAPDASDLATADREKLAAEKGQNAVVLKTELVRAKVVCSAVGGLVEPKQAPDVPGMETFEGDIQHLGKYRLDTDFRDKDVVVVGTGCSAAQVIPQIIKPEYGAKSVTQLLRSPPWVQPSFPKGVAERFKTTIPKLSRMIPGFQNALRKVMFMGIEAEFIALFSPTEKARAARQEKAKDFLAHVKKVVPEKYREILTPDYELFCKRRVIDEGWFESLQHPNVEITSLPLTRVQAKTVTLGPGRHYPPMHQTSSSAPTEEKTIPADIILLANGYETGEWLHPLDVTGKGGRSLYDVWNERGGSQAYLGTAMDGFPNFFMIFGPNTATGHSSVILASENMVNYSLNFIKPILNGEVRTYEVKEEAEREWTKDIQDLLKKSVFMSGCKNWYVKDGWNATVYPRTQIDFTLRCMFPRYSHWTVSHTSKGLKKKMLQRILRVFGIFSTIAGLLYAYRIGLARTKNGLRSVAPALRGYIAAWLDALRSRV